MTPASSYRRRLIALVFAIAGLLLILYHDRLRPELTVKLLGPSALLFGLVGIVIPRAVHDFLKPEFGHLQLWVEAGSWQWMIGFAAGALGAAIGIGWWLAG